MEMVTNLYISLKALDGVWMDIMYYILITWVNFETSILQHKRVEIKKRFFVAAFELNWSELLCRKSPILKKKYWKRMSATGSPAFPFFEIILLISDEGFQRCLLCDSEIAQRWWRSDLSPGSDRLLSRDRRASRRSSRGREASKNQVRAFWLVAPP